MDIVRVICVFFALAAAGFFLPILYAQSAAELHLLRTYKELGVPPEKVRETRSLIVKFFQQIKRDGLTDRQNLIERLIMILEKGMLLELSDYGILIVNQTVNLLVDAFFEHCQEPFSSDQIKEFCVAAKPSVFEWLALQLGCYDRFSFCYTYFNHDAAIKIFGTSKAAGNVMCVFRCNVLRKGEVFDLGPETIGDSPSHNQFNVLKDGVPE